jgi:hypothetical protein
MSRGVGDVHGEALMGVSAVESAVTRVLLNHGGAGAVAVVRWLVTGEHADDDAGGVIVDRGWPLSGLPDVWT